MILETCYMGGKNKKHRLFYCNIADESCKDLYADTDMLRIDFGILLSVDGGKSASEGRPAAFNGWV
jgi:hypothetical protein